MLNIIDLFSGAGGLTEGFRENNHFNIICHIEKDKEACSSLVLRNIYYYLKQNNNLSVYFDYITGILSKESLYSYVPKEVINNVINKEISNNTMHLLFKNINSMLQGKYLDGIIGGPPCQAYSTIGRAVNKAKKKSDERIYLYKYYISFLKEYQPKFFIFENVKGLLSFRDIYGDLLLPKIIDEFNQYGYDIIYKVINANDYGVSQNRERLFIVGYRKDLKFQYSFFDYLKSYIEEAPTLKELFDDLPKLQAGETSNKYYRKSFSNYISKYIRNERDILLQHTARPHNRNDLKIYKLVVEAKKQGKNIKYNNIPKQLQTHSNKSSFLDRYKALDYDSVSHTVVAHISKDGHYYIHPDIKQNRSITVREAARIQGFPDNFVFEHSRSAAFKQIGNAVPPILSHKIAQAILDFIYCEKS